MIIVIPSYREPDLESALTSLCQCDEPGFPVEVIVVLNAADDDAEGLASIKQTVNGGIAARFREKGRLKFYFITETLPPKHAGVGLARKVGMDEAVRRFGETGYDGLIVCLDADCRVSHNYLRELGRVAVKPEYYNSVCLYFEHDLNEWKTESPEKMNKGIVDYELFLRYYKEALKWCGFPYAYHTVGSSMAVKCSAYCRAGGMNRRKAGEDFYFLHKVFPYEKVIELNTVTVFPSSRVSTRVPFGTGRSQMNIYKNPPGNFLTYDFRIFELIKQLCAYDFYLKDGKDLPAPLLEFLSENDFGQKIREIKKNTASMEQFVKRFFSWMDGFMILKLVHALRHRYYPDIKVENACSELLKNMNLQNIANSEEQLLLLRKIQQNNK